MNSKSQLSWDQTLLATWVKTWRNRESREESIDRAPQRCGGFRCVWIWICASTVWWVRCGGLCGGYSFSLTAAVEESEGYNPLLMPEWNSPKQSGSQVEAATDGGVCLISLERRLSKSEDSKNLEDVTSGLLFDFHYLNPLPLERGPFPSINNWHFITYPPPSLWQACALMWAALFLSAPCFVLIAGQIGAPSKGFPHGASQDLVTSYPWNVVRLARNRISSRFSLGSSCQCILLIWVKYSQRITEMLKWHHLKWNMGGGGFSRRACCQRGGFHQRKLSLLQTGFSLIYLSGVSCSVWWSHS